jgi:hypothetical protein
LILKCQINDLGRLALVSLVQEDREDSIEVLPVMEAEDEWMAVVVDVEEVDQGVLPVSVETTESLVVPRKS